MTPPYDTSLGDPFLGDVLDDPGPRPPRRAAEGQLTSMFGKRKP